MNKKMQACFTPHVIMHSLIGLGLGLVIADIWDSLAKWWIGVIVIVVATLLDMTRKA